MPIKNKKQTLIDDEEERMKKLTANRPYPSVV
jgi:hypothetical protein